MEVSALILAACPRRAIRFKPQPTFPPGSASVGVFRTLMAATFLMIPTLRNIRQGFSGRSIAKHYASMTSLKNKSQHENYNHACTGLDRHGERAIAQVFTFNRDTSVSDAALSGLIDTRVITTSAT